MGPAVTPDGTRLYVCNRFNNDVSVIDLESGQEVTRVPAVREPIAAAVMPLPREETTPPVIKMYLAIKKSQRGKGCVGSILLSPKPPEEKP
jgi:YVTN family beta-propeller protein